MTRKPHTELYLGIVVWLLSVVIAFIFWIQGDSDIQVPLTQANAIVATLLFILYLVGYCSAHVSPIRQFDPLHKLIGLGVATIAAALLSSVYFTYGMMGCMFMMLIVQLPALVTQKWGMVIAVLIPAIFVFMDYMVAGIFMFTYIANIALFVVVNVLALTISYRVISEREANKRSKQLVRELEATQILLSATTKRDERLRIARNLHDILGHQLTALGLQLEVASHVTADQKQKHIDNAKTIGANLLSNVRDTVSEFRGEKDFKLDEALAALIKGIPNLDIQLLVDWDESHVDERQVEVIFRSAQEALTNIMKHSTASHCEVSVSDDENKLMLKVKDDGKVQGRIQPGNGLMGLIERVEKIDGQVNYSGSSDGFLLCVTLPIGDS